jgi:hypothetical protein
MAKTCKHPTCANTCRRVKKSKRVKLTPLPRLMDKAQKLCNEYIRLRDQGKPCISCNSEQANQAGHYISVRMSSFLRFDERNIWLQCAGCNCYKYGSPITYRMELVKRIGEFEVERLERDFIENKMYKWNRQALEEVISNYSEKIKALKA